MIGYCRPAADLRIPACIDPVALSLSSTRSTDSSDPSIGQRRNSRSVSFICSMPARAADRCQSLPPPSRVNSASLPDQPPQLTSGLDSVLSRPSLSVRVSAWIVLLTVNVVGTLPWWHIHFTTVDLASILYDVSRIKAGYVPYRDTFNHHFVGYLLPYLLVSLVFPLNATVLKCIAQTCNFSVAVCLFRTLREVADLRAAWLGALLTVTVGWFWRWQGYALNVQSVL